MPYALPLRPKLYVARESSCSAFAALDVAVCVFMSDMANGSCHILSGLLVHGLMAQYVFVGCLPFSFEKFILVNRYRPPYRPYVVLDVCYASAYYLLPVCYC